MSFSDSESSHGGTGEYKFFKQHSRDRLLYEMLGASKSGDARSAWKVLIMDRVTMKVMSHSCKMADITDQGVSLVEDLFRRRQPLPSMDAIYFIQPSKENVVMFLSDMSGREPLYRKAYVFFSRTIPKELVNHIKCDTSVLPRIGALREMNLEYFSIDNQGFVTDQDPALGELFSDDAEKSRRFETCLNTMAARLASVFASLKELPTVRYQAAKTDDSVKARDLVPTKLAGAVYNIVSSYKSIPNFPQTETCDLLILDRSIDQIAPIIHEWTYDAMCHDLLQMDGNKYVVELPSKSGGGPEKKEVFLEEHDPLWLELRHIHIADASERLHEKLTTFKSKNKAAQIQRDGEISTRDLQKIVQALPQYNEQMEKLSLHVELVGQINTIIREQGLRDLGQTEQDLVFGDAGAKEVIAQLRKMQDSSPENKLRLLMIYAIVYPEKFEGDKGTKLMQLAKLSPEDMKVIDNMRLLARSPEMKTAKSSFSLKFDNSQKAKAKHAARQDRTGEEETWALFRFFPMIEELLEKLNKCELPKTEYAFVSEPEPAPPAQSGSSKGSARNVTASSAQPDKQGGPRSVRSRRTVRPASLDEGYMSDSVLKNGPLTDTKKMGQRIFVFMIGGATRSELRVCHKLTAKLKREVVLGSSSIDDPPRYITKLKLLSEKDLAVAPEPKLW